MTKFTKICQAAALALALSASAQASQTFNFTFSDVNSFFDGTSSVSGTILINGDGDGTFTASSITITGAPSLMLSDTRSGDFIFETGNAPVNSFTILGGVISTGGFQGYNGAGDGTLLLNVFGVVGFFNTSTYYLVDYSGGVESLTFSAATAPVPEPATWALFMAGAGLMGAAARRRRVAAKAA